MGAEEGITDYAVFQAVFGVISTVIIALEFKRPLLVPAERRSSVVRDQDRRQGAHEPSER